MKNTENKREGIMFKNEKFIKEFKIYKKHSQCLKEIKKAFEKDGYKFNNMKDIDNILLLLRAEPTDVSFLDDKDSDSNSKDKTPNIFDNPFFKPF